MLHLIPEQIPNRPLRLLCIGAHSDDLEIGCAGSVLTWLASKPLLDVTWVVLSAQGDRHAEANTSARKLLRSAASSDVVIENYRDGYLQSQYSDVKEFFESLKNRVNPDVIFTHWLHDRHQDHRFVSELTWNTWRNHLVFEYEIPKYEGDLITPNTYVPISQRLAKRKVEHLIRHFATQRSKDWFLADNFLGLMRIRGLECRSPSGFAEAFHARKIVL